MLRALACAALGALALGSIAAVALATGLCLVWLAQASPVFAFVAVCTLVGGFLGALSATDH